MAGAAALSAVANAGEVLGNVPLAGAGPSVGAGGAVKASLVC